MNKKMILCVVVLVAASSCARLNSFADNSVGRANGLFSHLPGGGGPETTASNLVGAQPQPGQVAQGQFVQGQFVQGQLVPGQNVQGQINQQGQIVAGGGLAVPESHSNRLAHSWSAYRPAGSRAKRVRCRLPRPGRK